MPWWEQNNLRLIQTNLRAKDAAMNRQSLMAKLKELSCNVLLLNTGGVTAFYPTALDFHYRSPWLGDGDLTGDMVKLCHDNGLRFMARFDFSKIHESVYVKHPEWAYHSLKGEIINYNGMVHACINSEYQRKCSLAILDEVTERYRIDGVFFNMFGYTTRDYSNNYHGICQCENCKALFRERYGQNLPTTEDPENPVYKQYQSFKAETVRELLDNIHGLIKGKSSELAISTYTDYKVDIIKKESNTEIHRPLPV
ncbi:MAG: family 10 glycosylhydrolase, partial [Treponema sp.]|nr:family 10 glycosylhydrolase [Treponema sp.]